MRSRMCFSIVAVSLVLGALPSSAQNLIANGRFLTDLGGWNAQTDEGSAVWASVGATEAGSAALTSNAAIEGVLKSYLTQCVAVAAGSSYVLSHQVRFSASESTTGFAETVIYWDTNPGCSGFISGSSVATQKASPGVFFLDSNTVTAPPGAVAAFVQVGIDKQQAGGTMSVAFDDISLVPSGLPSETLVGYLPVAASTPGAFGSLFKTSVQILNPNLSPISGHLAYHAAGVPASLSDPTIGFSLGPAQSYFWDDILATMGLSGAGSMDVYSSDGAAPPVVVTRIFNDAGAAGTTGFNEPLVRPADVSGGVGVSVTGFLIGPADTSKFRLNIGVRTLGTPVSLTAIVRDPSGATLTTVTKTYPANYFEQRSSADFLGGFALGDNQSIQITFSGGGLIVYGAVADDITNDPSAQFLPYIFAIA